MPAPSKKLLLLAGRVPQKEVEGRVGGVPLGEGHQAEPLIGVPQAVWSPRRGRPLLFRKRGGDALAQRTPTYKPRLPCRIIAPAHPLRLRTRKIRWGDEGDEDTGASHDDEDDDDDDDVPYYHTTDSAYHAGGDSHTISLCKDLTILLLLRSAPVPVPLTRVSCLRSYGVRTQ